MCSRGSREGIRQVTDLAVSILILISLFQVKHMFADYFLQTPKMLEGRGTYMHAGRAQHALVHAIGSALCLFAMGSPIGFVVAICVAEWIVHFHIDWAKATYTANKGHGPTDAGFWRAAGFDQFLHQMTYVLMTAAWLGVAVSP